MRELLVNRYAPVPADRQFDRVAKHEVQPQNIISFAVPCVLQEVGEISAVQKKA